MGGGTLYYVILGEGEGWLSQREAALSSQSADKHEEDHST